jgi:phosphonate transport system substrate-binding protein
MKTSVLRAAAVGAALVLSAATAAAETVRLAVTDISGLESLQNEFGKFREVLAGATGYKFDFYPVNNRTAAVEALNAKRVDFVITGPAEYVVFAKRTKAYPVVGFSRPDYFAGVIVMADSPYQRASDLKGKKVAMGDIGSTSNHLGPLQALADHGLDVRNDLQIAHISRNVAWEALKRGDIAAVGMNYGKFLEIREKEKAFEPGAFRVIARGPDLPNDMLLAGVHVDKIVVDKVRAAFTSHQKELIGAILVGKDNQKYLGMKFLPNVRDADYNYVRSMYATIGQPEYADFVGN